MLEWLGWGVVSLIHNTPFKKRQRLKHNIADAEAVAIGDGDDCDAGDAVVSVCGDFVVGFFPELLFALKGGGDDQLIPPDVVAVEADAVKRDAVFGQSQHNDRIEGDGEGLGFGEVF